MWTTWKEQQLPGPPGRDHVFGYSTDRGATWTTEYITDRGTDDAGLKDAMLLPNGGIAFNYDFNDGSGNLDVYYLERQPFVLNNYNINNADDVMYNLFPNPTNQNVHIGLNKIYEEVIINVFDVSGKGLSSETYFNTENPEVIIPESAGTYFLQVQADKDSSVLKVIKQ